MWSCNLKKIMLWARKCHFSFLSLIELCHKGKPVIFGHSYYFFSFVWLSTCWSSSHKAITAMERNQRKATPLRLPERLMGTGWLILFLEELGRLVSVVLRGMALREYGHFQFGFEWLIKKKSLSSFFFQYKDIQPKSSFTFIPSNC